MRTSCTSACVAALAAAGIALAGCGPGDYNPGPETCDRSIKLNPPVRYTGGIVEGGVYMTSAWDGDLLYFPGGMHYELVHDLGATPRMIEAYVGFDPHGTRDFDADTTTDEGVVSLGIASGNQVELLDVTDQHILLRNAECVDYWLLVVASAGATP
ncbi:MAG: hypothetical protein U0441_13995 [Polyangiaceae bacterium]